MQKVNNKAIDHCAIMGGKKKKNVKSTPKDSQKKGSGDTRLKGGATPRDDLEEQIDDLDIQDIDEEEDEEEEEEVKPKPKGRGEQFPISLEDPSQKICDVNGREEDYGDGPETSSSSTSTEEKKLSRKEMKKLKKKVIKIWLLLQVM